MSDPTFIYFIQAGSDPGAPIKIGFSAKPGNRLAQLQGSHYERLHLIGITEGNRFAEARLHDKLTQFALGREWYAAVPEVFAEIEEPIAKLAIALDSAVIAREHLQRAIALLRGADHVLAFDELRHVSSRIHEAIDSQGTPFNAPNAIVAAPHPDGRYPEVAGSKR